MLETKLFIHDQEPVTLVSEFCCQKVRSDVSSLLARVQECNGSDFEWDNNMTTRNHKVERRIHNCADMTNARC
jgi:hypothetical protein